MCYICISMYMYKILWYDIFDIYIFYICILYVVNDGKKKKKF